MDRRDFLKSIAMSALMPARFTAAVAAEGGAVFSRVRPGDPGWPSEAQWNSLDQTVGRRLIKVGSPLDVCRTSPGGEACRTLFDSLRNPYFIGENAAFTETSGWIDAWTSKPSAYAVRVRTTNDVVATVNFARENKLRLVVRGGGHSYQGTSDSADSLMVWTEDMNGIVLHDAFVPRGCDSTHPPQPAVTIESGARWLAAYNAVTTSGGRYVQGGGCATVGVAGFIHGGGFGSFSKRYGQGAAALLEAEIVTADGGVLVVNACNHPDLFWAVKGGGGGSFGVLTKVTLRTRELPETFGGVFGRVKARSDAAFRDLIARMLQLYADKLFNPHWGEEITFGADNTLTIAMVFQDLDRASAEAAWRPFTDALAAAPSQFVIEQPFTATAVPARRFWDAAYMEENHPGMMIPDSRPGAPRTNVFWAGDAGQVGFFLHGYTSAWLPASTLSAAEQPRLADALFAATRHWRVRLHVNKGLAGAPEEEIRAARDTAMNPAVADAFALAIIAGAEPPAFAGVPGHEPDLKVARADAQAIGRATAELLKAAPGAGSYLSEGDYFDPDWKRSYWGPNYERLASVKRRYDPDGLFFTHHGVGSDEWSADGFTRLATR